MLDELLKQQSHQNQRKKQRAKQFSIKLLNSAFHTHLMNVEVIILTAELSNLACYEAGKEGMAPHSGLPPPWWWVLLSPHT
jgi:hypothetical protein